MASYMASSLSIKVWRRCTISQVALQLRRSFFEKTLSAHSAISIKTGDTLPNITVYEKTPKTSFPIHDLFRGQKGILFAVVGAFMPGCKSHVPEYLSFYDKFQEEGYKILACIAVNDPYVMDAWGKVVDPDGQVRMLADVTGEFTEALGTQLDSVSLLGNTRSRRYGLLIEDNIVRAISTEPDNTGLACLLCIQRLSDNTNPDTNPSRDDKHDIKHEHKVTHPTSHEKT